MGVDGEMSEKFSSSDVEGGIAEVGVEVENLIKYATIIAMLCGSPIRRQL